MPEEGRDPDHQAGDRAVRAVGPDGERAGPDLQSRRRRDGRPAADRDHDPVRSRRVKSLADIKPGNVNGTALAVDATGGLHVAFVTDTGLYYGKGGGTSPFDVQPVVELPHKLKTAGPIGWPAITVDDQGLPWIAWAMQDGNTQSIEVASFNGKNRFVTQTVATIKGDSDVPQRVAIGITKDGPMVAYSYTAERPTPMAAVQTKHGWTSRPIEVGGGGFGLAMAVGKDGVPTVSYLTDEGIAVHVATEDGGSVEGQHGGATQQDARNADVGDERRGRRPGRALRELRGRRQTRGRAGLGRGRQVGCARHALDERRSPTLRLGDARTAPRCSSPGTTR